MSLAYKRPLHRSARIRAVTSDFFDPCLLVMKLTFRRLSLTSPESFAINNLRSWVLEQLHHEGEPLRWAITSIHRCSETALVEIEVEAVLVSP